MDKEKLNAAASEPDALPECVDCGACCHSNQAQYIRIFEHDFRRLEARALAFVDDNGNERSMRFEGGVCSALGQSEAGCAICRIYPQRPDACRWLERGSTICRDMIAQHAGTAAGTKQTTKP